MNFPEQNEKKVQCIGIALVLGYAVVLLLMACLGPIRYDEIDTNALSVISLQYRGSTIINQSDIEQARVDFPDLYKNIYSFDDLRASKLLVVSENEWLPFYIPIYPALCVPVKLFLAFLGLDQQKTFFITNALLISGALLFLQLKLKVSPIQKIFAVLLLAISPIIYYNNYINYEAYIFSMLIVALVLYCNGNRKTSAIFISLANLPNTAVAAIGLVMIAEYFVKILWDKRKETFLAIFQKYWKETAIYALCFAPCLLPTLRTEMLGSIMGSYSLGSVVDFSSWLTRILTYLFDPTLGFALFAPAAILLFFLLVIISAVHKRWQSIVWLGMFLAVVATYSLMLHINCGMILCARYVMWSYPIIPLYLATDGYVALNKKLILNALYSGAVVINMGMMWVNPDPGYLGFTNTAIWMLKNAPALYNPFSATFYSRTLHIDGAYYITDPAYYKDQTTEQIYKLIYKADPGQAEQLYNKLKGDDASMAYLKDKLERIGTDGKYHYINFPQWGEYKVYEKSPVETGELLLAETIGEVYNVSTESWGTVSGYQMPITIEPNTEYQIELELSREFDYTLYADFFVDFYGSDGYDNPAQEKSNFLHEDVFSYKFYFNSEQFEGETKEVYARIFTPTMEPAKITHFCVTKLVPS